MTVKELIARLQEMPENAIIAKKGRDLSFFRVRAADLEKADIDVGMNGMLFEKGAHGIDRPGCDVVVIS